MIILENPSFATLSRSSFDTFAGFIMLRSEMRYKRPTPNINDPPIKLHSRLALTEFDHEVGYTNIKVILSTLIAANNVKRLIVVQQTPHCMVSAKFSETNF